MLYTANGHISIIAIHPDSIHHPAIYSFIHSIRHPSTPGPAKNAHQILSRAEQNHPSCKYSHRQGQNPRSGLLW
jgi:hypothetical protein